MASASRFAPTPVAVPLRRSAPSRSAAPPHPETRFPSVRARYRLSGGGAGLHESSSDGGEGPSFGSAVALFNGGDYHASHDVLEELWIAAEEPAAHTLLHGVLQCAVGLHHLFNQNHRGAMMELGEGLCKLRKMRFEGGPFLEFEREVAATLEFLYHTQMELAACTDDICIAMDGSERSYQLLGSFAAGQHLYNLDFDADGVPYIVFTPGRRYGTEKPPRAKIPMLLATEEHLKACL